MARRGRPRIPIGSWGDITVLDPPKGSKKKSYRARAYYRDIDGVTRLVQASASSKGRAKADLSRKLRERSGPSDSTVRDLAKRWEATIPTMGIRPQSADSYRRTLRNHVLPRMGNLDVSEVTPAIVLRHLSDMEQASPGNLSAFKSVLKHLFGLAVLESTIPMSPMNGLPQRKAKASAKKIALDLEMVQNLRVDARKWQDANHDKVPISDLMELALLTSARVSELLSLRWDMDVDLTAGTVTLQSTQVQTKDRGVWRQDETKGSKIITHSLTGLTLEVLLQRKAASDNDGFVFARPDTDGEMMWTRQMANTTWHKIRGKHKVRFHDLRAAVAEAIRNETGHVEAATFVLGQSDVDVTERHYLQNRSRNVDIRTLIEKQFGEFR